KRLVKKYASLKDELKVLEELLLKNPKTGTSIGRNAYKIRISVKSKGKGKRGGIRVITYLEIDLIIDPSKIFLLSIYDKTETEYITKNELARLINARSKEENNL
ncbi:MAG: addiction module toxin RelE, partial [Bacteroidota bacterium]